MTHGRFAPSPTGRLHLGNLRTALGSWLWARSQGGPWHVRFEDLDLLGSKKEHEQGQLNDLADLGMTSDLDPVRQSSRFEHYRTFVAALETDDLVYSCFCTRKEIREEVARSASAPNGPSSPGHYPGTCRSLTAEQQRLRRAENRPAALRVNARSATVSFTDVFAGHTSEVVDDFVIQRNDGTPAYNLAVLVDDVEQGVKLVVRGDDLLSTTPRQLWLGERLGLQPPQYAHIPLVLNEEGGRLAKRDGSVTLPDRHALGERSEEVLSALLRSLGMDAADPVHCSEVVEYAKRFDPTLIPRTPMTFGSDGQLRPSPR